MRSFKRQEPGQSLAVMSLYSPLTLQQGTSKVLSSLERGISGPIIRDAFVRQLSKKLKKTTRYDMLRGPLGAQATPSQGMIMPTAAEGSLITILSIKHRPRHRTRSPSQVSDCTRGVRCLRTIAAQMHNPRPCLTRLVQNGPHIGPLPNARGVIAILKPA